VTSLRSFFSFAAAKKGEKIWDNDWQKREERQTSISMHNEIAFVCCNQFSQFQLAEQYSIQNKVAVAKTIKYFPKTHFQSEAQSQTI
jgi:hypothetical protein